MVRKKRKKSASGCYHVIMRGNKGDNIYTYKEQKEFLFENLRKHEETHFLDIMAWCVMSNHVHLVLKAGFDDLVQAFHSINTRFAKRENFKRQEHGHVFQGRFWSEPIETDDYLLRAIRYIHNNPVKAGLVQDAEEWDWSSYSLYRAGECSETMRYAYDLIGGSMKAVEKFHRDSDLQFRMFDIDKDRMTVKDQYFQLVMNELSRRYGIRKWSTGTICKDAVIDAVVWLDDEGDYPIREIAERLEITFYEAQRILKIYGA